MTTTTERITRNLRYHPSVLQPTGFPYSALISVAGCLAGYEVAGGRADWKVEVTDHHSAIWTDSAGDQYRVTVTPL